MVICQVASGVLFFAVHFFSKGIDQDEYGVFGVILALLNLMVGLQPVFAQQTASAITERQQQELASTARGVLKVSIYGVIAAAIILALFQDPILRTFKIKNSVALWMLLFSVLFMFVGQVFYGLLQGAQNFKWLGWSIILNSLGRLAGVAVAVVVLKWQAAGMTAGILLGLTLTLVPSAWQSRSQWMGKGAPVDWGLWIRRVIPLVVGAAAFQFMFSGDPIFVQSCSDGRDTGFYTAAGTLGRALCVFTVPVVTVMFSKIARTSALSTKSNFMGLALIITAIMASIGAFGLTVIAPWLIPKFVFKPEYAAAIPLLPWYCAAMIPLALANVLFNDCLARQRYAVVPWAALVALCYAGGLYHWGTSTYAVTGFKDAPALVAKLGKPAEGLSTFLHSKVSESTAKAWAANPTNAQAIKAAQALLANDLNDIIQSGPIYDAQRFSSVRISPETRHLLDANPQGQDLTRLNRLLLEDAYPQEMGASHSGSFIAVLKIMCVFNAIFLAVVVLFSWRESRNQQIQPVAAPAQAA